MIEELKQLFCLQKIDDTLFDIEKLKKEIPEKFAHIDAEIRKREKDFLNIEKELNDTIKKRRRLEGNLDTENEKLKRYQKQLFEVKTNKEYTAMLSEIENTKAKISELEEEILILFDKTDHLVKEVEVLRKKLEDEKQKLLKEKEFLSEKMKSLAQDLLIKKDERTRLIVGMKPELFNNYERIRKGRNGSAVVQIKKGFCSGCFTSLPAQFIHELKKRDKIYTCEHCGRILVWDESDE